MLSKAISKIKAEIDKKQDAYTQFIGAFLIKHLDANPHDAEKIVADGKTIAGSLAEMQKVASKKKVGNMAVLTPDEGFGIVAKYFGIKPGQPAVSTPVAASTVPPVPKELVVDFDIKLDDLLSR